MLWILFLFFLTLCQASTPPSLWIIGTASVKTNSSIRQDQYHDAIHALAKVVEQPALQRAYPQRHVVYLENNGGPSSYLNDYMNEVRDQEGNATWSVFYTTHNLWSNLTNSGLKELLDEFAFVKSTPKLQDHDWLVKVTGRYRILVPSPLIEAMVSDTEAPGQWDAVIRPGAYYQRDWPLEHYSKDDAVTGLFAMRVHTWKLYAKHADIDPLSPAEWWLARFVQRHVPRERVLWLPKLGAMIAPGSDTYYEI